MREAVLVYLPYLVMHISIVFHHQQRIMRQCLQERSLGCAALGKLGNNLHRISCLGRELGLYLEGAQAVYLIAKEIYTERQLGTEGINVDDTSSHGKLSWLIHIVGCLKT